MVCASEQAVILDDVIYDAALAEFARAARLPGERRGEGAARAVHLRRQGRRQELRRAPSSTRRSSARPRSGSPSRRASRSPTTPRSSWPRSAAVGPQEPLTREKLAPGAGRAARRRPPSTASSWPSRWSSSTASATPPRSTPQDDAADRGVRQPGQGRPGHRERALLARRHRRHLQRVHPVADARLRLLRPQLGVQQRLGGQPGEHQADRPAQQQPAVVQGAGQDLLRAERHPLPRGHARRRARHHRHRRDDDDPRLRRQDHRRPEPPVGQGRAADHRPGRARAVRADRPGAAPRRCATSGPTRSSRSAAARRWTPPRSCGCCTSTRRSTSPTSSRSSSTSASARSSSPSLGELAQLVCIPTTSGTGAEVTPFAVITDPDTGQEVPAGRLRADPVGRDHRPGPHREDAAVAGRRLRVRRPHARHRGVRLRLRQRLHRRHGAAGRSG